MRALNRARRSAQHTASASAAIQPNRGASFSDQRKMISAGAVPKAILSLRLIELGAELALRPKQAGDASVKAVEHAGPDDDRPAPAPFAGNSEANPVRPKQSASA
jgi:hypothetical protein